MTRRVLLALVAVGGVGVGVLAGVSVWVMSWWGCDRGQE